MYIIGENIHIMSQKVKDALAARDADYFRASAEAQVEAGAQALDLNLGPRKKDWEEVFPWMVQTVESAVDVPLSLDSTNIAGIEAGLKAITKAQPIINSTSAEEERLEAVPLLAKQYDAKLVALTMGKSGIPVGADERVNIAIEALIPRMLEIDYPISDLIIDPLVLTVSGCQEYGPELIEAVRTLQVVWDPPPAISVGLSNVSNAVPNENRPLINQVYCAMLMGVGFIIGLRLSAVLFAGAVIGWLFLVPLAVFLNPALSAARRCQRAASRASPALSQWWAIRAACSSGLSACTSTSAFATEACTRLRRSPSCER